MQTGIGTMQTTLQQTVKSTIQQTKLDFTNYISDEENYNRLVKYICSDLLVDEDIASGLLHDLYLEREKLEIAYRPTKSKPDSFIVLKARMLYYNQARRQKVRRNVLKQMPTSKYYTQYFGDEVESYIDKMSLNKIEREIFSLFFDDMKNVNEVMYFLKAKYKVQRSRAYGYIASLREKVMKVTSK